MTKPKLTFHLLANAHLDPVWLWDWREGLNEGIITCRTMLDLMDDFPDYTFIRGEASIYEHIEKHDPATFKRIAKRVAEGRWDVIGGSWVQADNNLPATETIVRQYLHGNRTFTRMFGKAATAGWAPDAFGQAGGLPDIMAGAGLTDFMYCRPEAAVNPFDLPAFWWEGPAGNRVLAYRPYNRWYCFERHELFVHLDRALEAASRHSIENVAFLYGVGNHGGGATRRMLEELPQWAAKHPEVKLVHSGLHRFFAALRAEVKKRKIALPVQKNELNFVLRGCYASVAKFKWAFRRTEARLMTAETLDGLVAADPVNRRKPADLDRDWQGVLFNSFHDILPGTSIERAYDDLLAWLGGTVHTCRGLELDAVNTLAARIDTSVPAVAGDMPTAIPFLVWNPQAQPFRGHIELEGHIDYRPVAKYNNKVWEVPLEVRGADRQALPFQDVDTEHRAMVGLPLRKRVVVPVELPPLGWSVVTLGYVENPEVPMPANPVRADTGPGGLASIANGIFRIAAKPGDPGIAILKHGEPLFPAPGLGAAVYEDPYGAWGGLAEEPDSLTLPLLRDRWVVTKVELREAGRERGCLWVRLASRSGGASRLDLTIQLYRERAAVDIGLRVFWDQRSARLRLLMPGAESATFETIAGTSVRGAVGEVPALRWARVQGGAHVKGSGFGFASDALSSFSLLGGDFTATVVRASRYADDVKTAPDEVPWRPAVDCGELLCRLVITGEDADLPRLAGELTQPPQIQTIAPHPAPRKDALPRSGSLAVIAPASLALLALKPAADGKGLILRVQEIAGAEAKASVTLFGQTVKLGKVKAHAIASWRLRFAKRGGWSATACDLLEQA
jgi:alpha-mannosidase